MVGKLGSIGGMEISPMAGLMYIRRMLNVKVMMSAGADIVWIFKK